MMGYLQRLVVRAEGVSTAPSLAPTGHRQITEDQTSEPFTGDDLETPATKLVTRPPIVIADANRPQVEVDRKEEKNFERPFRNEGNESGRTPSERVQIGPPLINETLVASTNRSESRNQQSAQRQDEVVVPVKPAQSPPQPQVEPIGTPSHFENRLSFKEAEQGIASSRLEPQHVEVLDHESTAPSEPRLVIGQLKVEVISTPPTRPREIVRTVTRAADSSQSKMPDSSISRLRFGLGQM